MAFILPSSFVPLSLSEGEKDAQRSSTEQSGEAEGEAAKPQS